MLACPGTAGSGPAGAGDGRQDRRPHLTGDAFAVVAGFRDDPVLWVRAAATRAVARLTRAGA